MSGRLFCGKSTAIEALRPRFKVKLKPSVPQFPHMKNGEDTSISSGIVKVSRDNACIETLLGTWFDRF